MRQLSEQQKDELENKALRAFGGRVERDLVHGFRLIRDANQIAAVYWDNNFEGNDVEIALCDPRLTDAYDLSVVRQWLEHEKASSNRRCNVHKNGSDWPILGFSFAESIAFLERCRALRHGLLPRDAFVQGAALSGISPEKPSAVDPASPVSASALEGGSDRARITDSQVAAAYRIAEQVFDGESKTSRGIDVLVSEHGLNRATAGDFIIAFKHLLEGKVFHRAMSAVAMRYFMEQIFATRGRENQANAVNALYAHIDYYEGHYKTTMHLFRAIAADFNKLVQEPLNATDIEMEFSAAVERSLRGSRADRLKRLAQAGKKPTMVKIETSVFRRNPDVVAEVLLRANGKCELCRADAPFVRAKDMSPYLEVHHRIPLSDEGDDSIENALALCPNCHRRLHYGLPTQ
jgi:5-methylcytosine-specific restriction protein A